MIFVLAGSLQNFVQFCEELLYTVKIVLLWTDTMLSGLDDNRRRPAAAAISMALQYLRRELIMIYDRMRQCIVWQSINISEGAQVSMHIK